MTVLEGSGGASELFGSNDEESDGAAKPLKTSRDRFVGLENPREATAPPICLVLV